MVTQNRKNQIGSSRIRIPSYPYYLKKSRVCHADKHGVSLGEMNKKEWMDEKKA
jgi:hypothetical protein